MIDKSKIEAYYNEKKIYNIELGIGEECQRGCIYCYLKSLPHENKKLNQDIIKDIIEDAGKMGVAQIDWTGGEPFFNSKIFEHIKKAKELDIKNRVWTGGLPLENPKVQKGVLEHLRNGILCIQLSTVNAKMYGKLHPERPLKDLEIILRGIKKLLDEGFPRERLLISATFTKLQNAEDFIHTIDYMEKKFGIKTWPTVYSNDLLPESLGEEREMYIPDELEVKKVYDRFYNQWKDTTYLDITLSEKYCTTSIAILSNGKVSACSDPDKSSFYLKHDSRLSDIVEAHKSELIKDYKIPENAICICRRCNLFSICQMSLVGSCMS